MGLPRCLFWAAVSFDPCFLICGSGYRGVGKRAGRPVGLWEECKRTRLRVFARDLKEKQESVQRLPLPMGD